MNLDISGFIEDDRFDLHSYLTYLFIKLQNNHAKKEETNYSNEKINKQSRG